VVHATGEIQRLVVTILISDVRGYSGIAEVSDPSRLAGQLKEHRTVASDAVLAEHGALTHLREVPHRGAVADSGLR